MKVIIPVEEKTPEAPVCVSFGRTPLFLMADTESGKTEFFENTAVSSQGGAGIKAAQLLADKGAQAVITYRCGENAASVLEPAGIKLYKAQNCTAAENIEMLKGGRLVLLNEISEGLHNHGGKE